MSSLKNSISVSSLALLGIVLLLFEKLKNIIAHHQFRGEPLKEFQMAVVIVRTGASVHFLRLR